MKKKVIALIFFMASGVLMAQVDCSAARGDEAMQVRIIDTFLEKTAFIRQILPRIELPVEAVGVELIEKSKTVSFINEEKEFSIHIDKRVFERRLPPVFKGVLTWHELSTEIDCVIE